jgi:hypothetical protein
VLINTATPSPNKKKSQINTGTSGQSLFTPSHVPGQLTLIPMTHLFMVYLVKERTKPDAHKNQHFWFPRAS